MTPILAAGFFLLYKFFHVSGNVVAKGDGQSIGFVIILKNFLPFR